MKEIEVKFKVSRPEIIRKALEKAKAKFLGRAFERTVKFDTPDDYLRRHNLWIRTRTGFKNVLTMKEKIGRDNKKFKQREETELEISDVQRMGWILKRLGFSKTLVMEKYREKWRLKNTEVVLDKLPFGNFIEIEGNRKSIEKTEKILGLKPQERIVLTYWHLWEEIRQRKGIKNKNIVFKNRPSETKLILVPPPGVEPGFRV